LVGGVNVTIIVLLPLSTAEIIVGLSGLFETIFTGIDCWVPLAKFSGFKRVAEDTALAPVVSRLLYVIVPVLKLTVVVPSSLVVILIGIKNPLYIIPNPLGNGVVL
jgi:hypothetical protein